MSDDSDARAAGHCAGQLPIQALRRDTSRQEHPCNRPGRNDYDRRPPCIRIGLLRKRLLLLGGTPGADADDQRPLPTGAAVHCVALFGRRTSYGCRPTGAHATDEPEATTCECALPAEPAIPIGGRLGRCSVLHADCIVDVTMRMMRIPEMKRIQGFGDDYVLLGTQEEQKKFLGNAVVTQMATAWAEAVAKAIILDIWPQIETARKAVSDFTAAIRECFL